MTVEELNVKITADAENFKRAVSEANSAMESFRRRAVTAGEEVSGAFAGLLGVGMTGTLTGYAGSRRAVLSDYSGRTEAAQAFADGAPEPSIYGFTEYLKDKETAPRAASVTLPGSGENAAAAGSGVQPINITTEVILDGDKVGESVSRYNIRRSRITNGIEE